MKKSIWIQSIALLLVLVLTGCSASNIAPANTFPSSSIATPTGEQKETTTPTNLTEVSGDPTISTATEPSGPQLNQQQKNAIAMLYYLATTTEEITISKNNRVVLEDIYSSLNNEINPGAIDEDTQKHLNNIRNVIDDFLNIDYKRERLLYIYNTQKAEDIKAAIPTPLSILALTNATDWHQFAITAVYTIASSYGKYTSAAQKTEQEYFLSDWELNEDQNKVILNNRKNAFNYMTNIVQKYGSEAEKLEFGKLTPNEEAITAFAQICTTDNPYTKIGLLEKKEKTYKYFGNYWLELADAYFLAEEYPDHYQKCLDCIAKYNELEINIFRHDFNIISILPKAIVAAQAVYDGEEYILNVQAFADAIINNANDDDWSVRYFAAQAYLDLYAKTNNAEHLQEAYEIIRDNVYELIDEQIKLNEEYLSEIRPIVLDTNEAKKLSKEDRKAEEKRIKAYNKSLEKERKTELPTLYEPLMINCELLFALIDKLEITDSDRITISQNLQPEKDIVFLVAPINNKFSLTPTQIDYDVELSKDSVNIPAYLLSQDSSITITVTNENQVTIFDDFEIKKVTREGETLDTFVAEYTSEKMKDYKWSANVAVTIEITNGNYCEPVSLNYKVKEYKENWIFSDSVIFEKE